MKHASWKLLVLVLCLCLIAVTAWAEPAYVPGTYEGTANGMGAVTATVTINEAAEISGIELDLSNETDTIGQAAGEDLVAQILAAQSTAIDGVSGATITTKAVCEAVDAALAQASGEVPAKEETTGRIINGENAGNYRSAKTSDYLGEIAAMQAEYAPKQTTLKNGVTIQRTPTEYVHHAQGYLGNLSFNNYRLDADNRGCAACHDSLTDLIQNMKFLHVQVQGVNDDEIDVMQCMDCHIRFDYYITSVYDNGNDIRQFGSMIHGIHYNSNTDFNGNCFTCHNASEDGNGMELWDDVKYEVLHGITDVSNEQIEELGGLNFQYDQTTIFPEDQNDIHLELWWWDGSDDQRRYDAVVDGLTGEEAGYSGYDKWTYHVHGHVAEEKDLTLQEIIDSAEKDGAIINDIFKFHCTADTMNGSMIANVNVTAIPITYVYDMCGGLTDGANWTRALAYDGFYTDHSIDRGGYIVYQINGEELTPANGYPALVWVPGGSCGMDVKCCNDLYAGIEEEKEGEWFYEYLGQDTDPSGYTNKPNVSILNMNDGQIIEPFTPYTLEGFADAYDHHIDRIEVSFDRGLTWTVLDVNDTSSQQFVHWTMEIPGLDTGAYVMYFNVFTDEGLEAYRLVKCMFNVQ